MGLGFDMNEQKLMQYARDLRKEEPHSPDDTLAGYRLGARCLDKCRATLLGWQGEFQYGCPMDQRFLQEAGLDVEEFKNFVATGASDNEVEQWIHEHEHVQR